MNKKLILKILSLSMKKKILIIVMAVLSLSIFITALVLSKEKRNNQVVKQEAETKFYEESITKPESETTKDVMAVTLTDADGNQTVVEGVATTDENGNMTIKIKDAAGNEVLVSGTAVKDSNGNITVKNAAVTNGTQLLTGDGKIIDVTKSFVGVAADTNGGTVPANAAVSEEDKKIDEDSKSQPQSEEVGKNIPQEPVPPQQPETEQPTTSQPDPEQPVPQPEPEPQPVAESGELTDLSEYLQNSYNHSVTTNTIITNSVGAFETPELYNKVMDLSNQWWQGQIADSDIKNQLAAQEVYHEDIVSYERLHNITAKKFSYSGKLDADFNIMQKTLRSDLRANKCSGENNSFIFARAYYDASSDTTIIYYVCSGVIVD